jgi:hypothetical protein
MTVGLLAGSLLCVHFVAEQQLTIGDFVLFGKNKRHYVLTMYLSSNPLLIFFFSRDLYRATLCTIELVRNVL